MDSLTQATLGAAVGEAVLGRRAGYRAPLWGALLGTLPDLDVLANPFLTEVQALAWHRSLTHSLLFAVLAAPLVGIVLARLHHACGVSRKHWTLLALLALGTHPLLDCFTTYGTQIFWPFSRYPVSFNAIFIIDPFYTVPLLVGLVVALTTQKPRRRWRANTLGLAVSSAYLLSTLIVKQHVTTTFHTALDRQDVRYERLLTTPTPFNILLWTGLADAGDTLYVGLYSLLDDVPPTRFQQIPQHTARLGHTLDQLPVERLLWFSRGYYTVSREDGQRFFHDLRFGRSDLWLRDSGRYPFTFRLRTAPSDPGRITGFEQRAPAFETDGTLLRRFLDRIAGQ